MKLVELTIYEIFGYVFPGVATMAGIYLFYWTFLLPADQDWSSLSTQGWTALLGVAYVFGHVTQAITNLILRKKTWRPEHRVFSQESTAIKSVLDDKARKLVGLEQKEQLGTEIIYDITDHAVLQRGETETRDVYIYREGSYRDIPLGLEQKEQLGAEVIYDIADHAVLQRGKTETRDVYIYREGFYRGMSLGLLMFAAGCFLRMIEPASIKVFGITLAVTEWRIFWIGVTAVVMTFFSFMRYLRFAHYRVKYALYGFLTMDLTAGEDKEGQ